MSEGSVSPAPSLSTKQPEPVHINREQQERIAKFLETRKRIFRYLNPVVALLFIFFVLPWAYVTINGILKAPQFALHPLANWYPLRIAVIYVYVAGILSALFFPFRFIHGFVLPKVYQIRPRSFLVWLTTWLIGSLRIILRWLGFVELIYVVMIIQPNAWWIWVTLILMLQRLSKTYLFPTFFIAQSYKCAPISDSSLIFMLHELIAHSARKTDAPCFFQMQRKSRKEMQHKELPPNGYLTGWRKTRSVILTDGLLNHFTFEEIKIILAHELGHHEHHDLRNTYIFASVLLAGELFAWNVFYHWYLTFPNFQSVVLLEQGYYWLLFLGGLRLGVYLLKRAYSRHNEWQADEFALQLTGDVFAFKTAMIRLMNMNNNPYSLSFGMALEQRHPSMKQRLQHADAFASRMEQSKMVLE